MAKTKVQLLEVRAIKDSPKFEITVQVGKRIEKFKTDIIEDIYTTTKLQYPPERSYTVYSTLYDDESGN